MLNLFPAFLQAHSLFASDLSIYLPHAFNAVSYRWEELYFFNFLYYPPNEETFHAQTNYLNIYESELFKSNWRTQTWSIYDFFYSPLAERALSTISTNRKFTKICFKAVDTFKNFSFHKDLIIMLDFKDLSWHLWNKPLSLGRSAWFYLSFSLVNSHKADDSNLPGPNIL